MVANGDRRSIIFLKTAAAAVYPRARQGGGKREEAHPMAAFGGVPDEQGGNGGGPGPPAIVPVVAVTTVVQAVVTMCSVIPAAIAPELARALGVPASWIGVLVSIIYLGAMATSLVGGVLTRRWGALRVNQSALVVAAAGVAMAAAPSLPSLAVGALLIGFGYGLTNPAASQLLMRVTRPKTRNLVFSLKQTGVPLGGVAAGLAAPTLTLSYGWQAALLTAVALALTLAVAVQPYRCSWDRDRDPGAALRGSSVGNLRLVWRHPALSKMSLVGFSYSAVQLCLTTFAVTMLVEDLGFGLVAAGFALSVLQVSGVVGRLLWGGVADRLGDGNRVLIATGAIAALAGAATTMLSVGTAPAVIYGVLIVFGASAIAWNGVFMAEVARLAPAGEIVGATGGVMVPTYGGVLVGPVLFVGVFTLVGDYTTAFGFCAAASLSGLTLALAARRRMGGG